MREQIRLQEYADFTQANDDRELLTNAGLSAEIHTIPDDDPEKEPLYRLQVPREHAQKAFETLKEYYESEKDETFEIMGDWGEGSVRGEGS